MYRVLTDFLGAWEFESRSTLKFLRSLTDASLAQPMDAEGWNLGRIAWHLATAPGQLLGIAGLPVNDVPSTDDPAPAHAAEIADTYERVAALVTQQVGAAWTDAMLFDEVSAFGQTWTRGILLGVLIGHQTHHRGQLSVLARQAGLCPPGVCGPNREEMAALRAHAAANGAA